jgi:DNA-binding MarR family transcriptional regulator
MDLRFSNEYGASPCVCAALRGAARSATQLYDLVLRPTGLKATQFIILQTIEEAGEMAQWRFARDHALAPETLSRRLAILRKKGLLSMRAGGNHGERVYSLTSEGKRALDRATPYWERAQERLRRTLGTAEIQSLLQLCRSAVTAAKKAELLRASNGDLSARADDPGMRPTAILCSVGAGSAEPRSGAIATPVK